MKQKWTPLSRGFHAESRKEGRRFKKAKTADERGAQPIARPISSSRNRGRGDRLLTMPSSPRESRGGCPDEE